MNNEAYDNLIFKAQINDDTHPVIVHNFKDEIIKYNLKICPYCYGDGMIFNPHINPEPITCPACEGSGTVTEEQLKEFESMI